MVKGCEFMGRPKGGYNHKWTVEEKLRIVNRYLLDGLGSTMLAKEEHVSHRLILTWVEKYRKYGIEGLENKKKTGNPFAALYTSKSLSELERLQLIVAKQDIEIERLKKGYIVKGVGANKEFVTLKDVSLK